MSQHTVGPWTVQQLESEHHGYTGWPVYAIRSKENICLAIVGDVDRYESERIPANARLIAAAPELLAALRDVRQFYQDHFDVMPVAFQTIDDIVDAAIARAEGGMTL